MAKPVIGFIGVGLMGHGLAKNILKGGYDLVVMGHRNRTPVESLLGMGASEAATPKDMAGRCDIIHLCLPNSTLVEATIRGPDGILAGARDGLIVIDTTTADPTSTLALAADLGFESGAWRSESYLSRRSPEALLQRRSAPCGPGERPVSEETGLDHPG